MAVVLVTWIPDTSRKVYVVPSSDGWPLVCPSCGEEYRALPSSWARYCSNGFHCCRDCTWKGGVQVKQCKRHESHEPVWMCHECCVLLLGEPFEEKSIQERGGSAYTPHPPCIRCGVAFPRKQMHYVCRPVDLKV